MKIRIADQTGGGIQFVVEAENDAERVVLGTFLTQTKEFFFHLHGASYSGDNMIGPSAFNFGTLRPPKD